MKFTNDPVGEMKEQIVRTMRTMKLGRPDMPVRNPFNTSSNVYLVSIQGAHSEIYRVDKDGDDGFLDYSDKSCAITSKPLMWNGNEVYFTEPGYKGTKALNEDTLLASDVYDKENDTISSLTGSKKTLKEENRARRARELLSVSSMPRQQLLLALGAGVGVGIMLAQYWL